MDGCIIQTRHHYRPAPELAEHSTANPTSGWTHHPPTWELTRPHPDAVVHQFEVKDGWLYVYWITYDLTRPTGEA